MSRFWLVLLLASAITAPAAAADPPEIWGHRGIRGGAAPENTVAAFQAAAEDGATGIELDVLTTRDGHVVVNHDMKIELPSGRRRAIARMTLAEVQAIDLGGGHRVPTLREVFAAIDPALTVNIELKAPTPRTHGLERKVAALIDELGVADRVVVSSFNAIAVRRMARLAPHVERALLIWPSRRELRRVERQPHRAPRAGIVAHLGMRLARATTLHALEDMVTPAHLGGWRRMGFDTFRTYPHPASPFAGGARLRGLAALGVRGLIVDRPAAAHRALGTTPRQVRRAARR